MNLLTEYPIRAKTYHTVMLFWKSA
jgi:hypothetical protein